MLNQTLGIVKEILPYWDAAGKEDEVAKKKWKRLHDQLAHELGMNELSTRYYSYTSKNGYGTEIPVSGWFSFDHVCGSFITAACPPNHSDPDRFIKERLSFIELVFRLRGTEILAANVNLPAVIVEASKRDAEFVRRAGPLVPGWSVDGARAFNATLNATFEAQVAELNERFRRARAPLNYHNGFIQVATDNLIEKNLSLIHI